MTINSVIIGINEIEAADFDGELKNFDENNYAAPEL